MQGNESPRNITVQISSGTIIKTILILLGLALLFTVKNIVLIILTAVVLASAIEPAAKWLMRHALPRVLAVVLLYAALGAFLFTCFYFVVPTLLKDVSSFLATVPQYMDSVAFWSPLTPDQVEQSKDAATSLSMGIEQSRIAVSDLSGEGSSIQGAVTDINNALNSMSQGFLQAISPIFGGLFGFIIIVVISFYLSVQEDGVEKFLKIITPSTRERYVLDLWRRVQHKIGLWMQGQLILALLVGVMVYLGLTVLGIRNALLFAVLAAFLETIPLFGPIIAAIPPLVTAYTDGGASAALLVIGLYLIIQQFENNLIYPLVVRKIVGVPPILVIVALLVGGELAGLLGILLSVPLAVILVEFIDDVQKRKALHE